MGCGVTAHVTPTTSGPKVTVEGDVNILRITENCASKAVIWPDTFRLGNRLLHPMLGRKDQREVTDWNTATSTVAYKFQQYIEQYGRDSIAFMSRVSC